MTTTASWNVIGHGDAARHLQRSIANRRVGHAFLIVGPEGVGRTTFALEFARALLCLNRDDGFACGSCASCRRIVRDASERNHPDLTVADVEWQTGLLGGSSGAARQRLSIDAIRWLRQDIVSRPILSRWKVQIVDDADRLSDTAPDAFLKTLEEPPGSAVIMLVASSLEAISETIRSRCLHIHLGLVARDDIVAALVERGVSDTEAASIASIARGRVATALKLTSDSDAIKRWREDVQESFGYISEPLGRLRLAGPIAANHTKNRERTFMVLNHCASLWRDALMLKAGLPESISNAELAGPLQEFARRFSARQIAGALDATRRAAEDLDRNFQARIALLAMIDRWPDLHD